MPLSRGQVLNNRYRIVKLLGKGGFGAVYKAWDLNLSKHWALKENTETSPEAERQFTREATILANLSHPNLPRVTDHFSIPGLGHFLVMDFVEGEDLESILQLQGPVQPGQAIAWIAQIADGLIYLHAQQPPVLHRDLKPANIRITPAGQAMLVDFGLVKVYDPHLRTTIGARAVTPGFSPPEQYGQGNTDIRTDIYALGATLYTLLTGQEPPESVQRVVNDQLILASNINPQVPANIGQAIARAMAIRPSQRYQMVSEFKQAITSSKPPSPLPAPIRPSPPSPAPRPPGPLPNPANPARQPRFLITGPIVLGASLLIIITAFCIFSAGKSLKPKLTQTSPPGSSIVAWDDQSTQNAIAWNNQFTQTAVAWNDKSTQTAIAQDYLANNTDVAGATLTPIAKPTRTATLKPRGSPTPYPTMSISCPGAPPIRVEVGNLVRVTTTEGDTLTLRSSPRVANNAVDKIKAGLGLRIISGPVCSNNFAYWEVIMPGTTDRGWVAEGDYTTYWLEPIY